MFDLFGGDIMNVIFLEIGNNEFVFTHESNTQSDFNNLIQYYISNDANAFLTYGQNTTMYDFIKSKINDLKSNGYILSYEYSPLKLKNVNITYTEESNSIEIYRKDYNS